jgi:ABC-type amino acid transport substrate-binding protein
LPPSEIRQALLEIIRRHHGTNPDEAIRECSRLFGFGATSGQLREIIDRQLQGLVDNGSLEKRLDKIYAPQE